MTMLEISGQSTPAGEGIEQKDTEVFGKLVDELWSIQNGLVWINYPSNETAPLLFWC